MGELLQLPVPAKPQDEEDVARVRARLALQLADLGRPQLAAVQALLLRLQRAARVG